MAGQARAAVAVSGAHHSSWNREVRPLAEGSGTVRALAKWDGAIEYRDDVTRTLREMFEKAGRGSAASELEQYRDALGVVLHENVHLLAARGTSHGMGSEAFREGAVSALEEGVTEAYKRIALDVYIDELGLERIAPGLKSVRADRSYPQYVPAAEVFAAAVGRRVDLAGNEVLRRLAVVNCEDKFRVAAELVYQASELPDLVPQQHRAVAIDRIVTGMKEPFAKIADFDPDDPLDIRMSPLAGAQADRAGYQQVRELTAFWQANQDLRKTLDIGLDRGARGPSAANSRNTNQATGRGANGRLARGDQSHCRPIERD
ncbi:hypothetical protein [Kribbella lupini]|uniref:Uncharacterized protein n=1 Tax=Kribbella lupini TaxID=291602 RepID=A0ABP4MAA8_9ACTN